MNTKTLALIAIFVALATALSVAGPKIPAPYAPGLFLYYELWEIPLVVAFLALGPKVGTIVAVINSLILIAVFSPNGPVGPFYSLIAVLSMFLGIYAPYKIATRGCKSENLGTFLQKHIKLISTSATVLGITTRVLVTTVVNYFALQQPYPIGFSYTRQAALLFLPLGALFNATVALYTIPIAIVVTIAIRRFKIQ
jgi:riboflavin transporter FmnP